MSGQQVGQVLDHSRADLTAKLVLVCIADRSRDDGSGAHPPVAEIMRRTGLSKSTVLRAVGRLESLGEVLVIRSHRCANEYLLTVSRLSLVTPNKVSQLRHPTGVTAMTPHTSIRPCTSLADGGAW